MIKSKKMEEVGDIVSEHVPQWSSGTRIGESLEQFLRIYGKKLLGTRSLILIFSDGWDLGGAGGIARGHEPNSTAVS